MVHQNFEDKMLEESPLNYSLIKPQRLLRTSELFALGKKAMERAKSDCIIKDHHSSKSLLNSWLKVEISQLEMEPVENLSMVAHSMMRTSFISTLVKVFFLW